MRMEYRRKERQNGQNETGVIYLRVAGKLVFALAAAESTAFWSFSFLMRWR